MPGPSIHPDLRSIARWLPRGAVGPRTYKPVRWLSARQSRRRPDGVSVETVGSRAARVHRPETAAAPGPALLWIHGGGFVIGTPAQDDHVCAHLARHLGITVVAMTYRLAPEHPFPASLEDGHDALVDLAGWADIDADRIAVGGASAGGGLAAGLALLARDRSIVHPAFQLLSYPMLDDRTALRTDVDERGFRLWNNKANRFGWESYTGRPVGSDRVDGLAAPGRHDDLTGLPPAWIGVGSLDLFHDEDTAYARRLEDAGVPCRLDVVDGAFHGFDSVRPAAPVTQAFRAAQVEALAGGLGLSVSTAAGD